MLLSVYNVRNMVWYHPGHKIRSEFQYIYQVHVFPFHHRVFHHHNGYMLVDSKFRQ